MDSNELVSVNVKLKLFESGNLVQQTFVNSLGQYSFDADSGNYTYNIDTMDVPFVIACPTSFSYVSVVNTTNIFHENKDFSLTCKPGFDVGVTSMILDSGFFRPASFAIVSISAGDMSSPYYLNCASGVSGNVIVIMNGPATILNAVPGSLVPLYLI
ncbi:MAG: hypothetical protein IPM91_19905 [Bacteroidetes bacterium]|nr:hypothetical protein [Bacteroidota bacterium]